MPMSFAASPVHVSLRSVLAATDFSEASRKPLRHALTMTRHYGAKFYRICLPSNELIRQLW